MGKKILLVKGHERLWFDLEHDNRLVKYNYDQSKIIMFFRDEVDALRFGWKVETVKEN